MTTATLCSNLSTVRRFFRLFTDPLKAALGLPARAMLRFDCGARALTGDSDYPMALLCDAARAQS